MDAGSHNQKMAAMLIEHLIAQGVEDFCLSPGSRSTSLALAIAENPRAHVLVHYDERGTAFYALGQSKGSRKPVAIVVTSGTAVANLLAAVMEASNDHVPLIILTADRPQELRDCSSNQTTDQVKLFSNFVRFQSDLSFSDHRFPPSSMASLIAHAVYMAQSPRPGPVHLNCQFREPLFALSPPESVNISPRLCEKSMLHPHVESIVRMASQVSQKKGLIIVGALPWDTQPDAIFALAEKLGWPIYADILSQLRSHTHTHLISHFDPLIEAGHHQPVEAVIHFGGRTLSKCVAEWLKREPPQMYLHISDCPTLMDPHAIVTHRMQGSPIFCAQQLSQSIVSEADLRWLKYWKEGDAQVKETLSLFFSQHSEISEPGIIPLIANHLSNDVGLFCANSMPIRDIDKFYTPVASNVAFFGNRGVSGIDGNIATATGIAQGMRKPLIALLGDLAFLHDVNSLSLLNAAEYPVCLIIVNNSGGGIFSFLPVNKKQDAFERFFAAAHPYTFSSAASLFNLSYENPSTPSALDAALSDFVRDKRSILIEIFTNRTENLRLHQEIAKAVRKSVEKQDVFAVLS